MKTTNNDSKLQIAALQWGIMSILAMVGFFALLMLCGEDTPENPMTLTEFLALKIGGLALLTGCIKAGVWCDKQGLLPEIKDDLNDKWEEE